MLPMNANGPDAGYRSQQELADEEAARDAAVAAALAPPADEAPLTQTHAADEAPVSPVALFTLEEARALIEADLLARLPAAPHVPGAAAAGEQSAPAAELGTASPAAPSSDPTPGAGS